MSRRTASTDGGTGLGVRPGGPLEERRELTDRWLCGVDIRAAQLPPTDCGLPVDAVPALLDDLWAQPAGS